MTSGNAPTPPSAAVCGAGAGSKSCPVQRSLLLRRPIEPATSALIGHSRRMGTVGGHWGQTALMIRVTFTGSLWRGVNETCPDI